MAKLNWSKDLSVGIEEMDQQHQEIVAMINDLDTAIRKGRAKDSIEDVINGLIEYTVIHFKAEEECFDKFGYEDAEAHKEEHAKFVEKMLDFQQGYSEGKPGLARKLMPVLSNWLVVHIMGSDKRYETCFKEHGLK